MIEGAEPVLRVEEVSKRFGGILANDAISLELAQGEMLALLGENGAGKTTLVNIIFGHYRADSGRVLAFGEELAPGQPVAAIAAGLGMVHQHFTLADNLTVLENVMIGTERLWRPWSDRARGRARLLALGSEFGLEVDPSARVGDLSIGERQRVEILKSLYRNARVLILDEPTAVLGPREGERLFATLRHMADRGLSLIFISHKLDEVLAAAGRVVVLRGGRVVAQRPTQGTTRGELAELMVGHRVVRPRRDAGRVGEVLLRCEAIELVQRGRRVLDRVSLEVRAGEILAVVGVAGNGQTSLGRLLNGLAQPSAGRIELFGQPMRRLEPRALVAAGVGRIPEDRLAEGVLGDLDVSENVALERLKEKRFARLGILRRSAAAQAAAQIIERFDVRGAEPTTAVRLLSGGNIQKLILGRNLAREPRLLIANQPTRGLDEGAVAAVHADILQARASGAGVVLVSEDLDEVLALADRVQAMVRGRLSAPIPASEADAQRLGLLLAGLPDEAGHAA